MAVGPFFIGTSAYLAKVGYLTLHISFRGSYTLVYMKTDAFKALLGALNGFQNFVLGKAFIESV
jgi:hypothetical protein